jgi:hypothetical protein
MGFNLGEELNKLKEFAIDAAPYAAMALPFTPWGKGISTLMGDKAPWMAEMMNSKFMNSIMGASLKDAAMSYTMAKLQDKENPHLIAKNTFMRNMFINANKAKWDMDFMMGGDKPGKFKYAEDVASDLAESPFDLSQNVMPRVTATQPDIASAMDPALANYYDYSTPGLNILEQSAKAAEKFKAASLATEALAGGVAGARQSLPFEYIEGEKNPLAGMGFMTKTKTKPGPLDRLLGRGKDLAELGIEAGTPAYDEFYDIGETKPDMLKMLGLGMDYFSDPLTEAQTLEKRKKRRRDEADEFAKMLMTRPDIDNPFESFFLGNKGGIASLANGGRIGYQGGGPAGMSLEELKKQIFSKYMATNYGDDQMAYDPEGAGPMTPTAPIDFDDDFIFNEGTIGPNPTFEDEFGGYLDLSSGPDNQGIHDAYEDYRMGGGTLDFEDWKISVQEVMNPEDWAAARGGRMGYQGGGELNAIPGGAVSGPGTGTSDSIPAKLSNNEFVFTENAVKAAGGGDVNAGAQQLYGIMNALDPGSARMNEPPVYS